MELLSSSPVVLFDSLAINRSRPVASEQDGRTLQSREDFLLMNRQLNELLASSEEVRRMLMGPPLLLEG